MLRDPGHGSTVPLPKVSRPCPAAMTSLAPLSPPVRWNDFLQLSLESPAGPWGRRKRPQPAEQMSARGAVSKVLPEVGGVKGGGERASRRAAS